MNRTMIGTTRYMSPERLRGETYARSSDVWGVGLLLLELIRGDSPFEDVTSVVSVLPPCRMRVCIHSRLVARTSLPAREYNRPKLIPVPFDRHSWARFSFVPFTFSRSPLIFPKVDLVQTLDESPMSEFVPETTSDGLCEILMGCLDHSPS
jgi:serine/threonine protein kinase